MSTTRGPQLLRRIATATAAVLTAGLVPLVGPAPVAVAAPSCTGVSEVRPAPLMPGCDDVLPPETTISSVAPAPNASAFIRENRVRIDFAGQHTDSDTDPIVYECLFETPTAAGSWSSCTSPFIREDLAESEGTPYTFKVQAVDQADDAIDLTAGVPQQQDSDAPDFDQSPATVTFKVDTVAPNTFLTRGPVDSIRPDWPVTTSASPMVSLNSNEASSFECTLNGVTVPCAEGSVTLANLSGGSKNFQARAIDAAGNLDPTPAGLRFFVPSNIKKSKGSGWKRVRASGYFGRDYLEADRVGATLRIKGQRNVREVRLLAPAGPRLGVLEVRVGKSQWYTVDLRSKKRLRQKVYLVRSHFTPLQQGTIQIRVKKLRSGGTVAVDALVARN